LKHVTVFRDERFYASHASAAIAANGDILVVFRNAPYEHVFAHVHPEARIDMVRSTDMSETWDPATRTTIYDPGDGINLNDPSITTLRDGTILVTAFEGYAPREQGEWGDKAKGVRGTNYYYVPSERWVVLLRSFDNGHTWEGPFRVEPTDYANNNTAVFASIVEFSDGRLLMPLSCWEEEIQTQHAALVLSKDKGKTWEPYSVMTSWSPEGSWMGETRSTKSFGLPSVIAYDDDHLLAAGWSNFEIGTQITSSDDGGKTWSSLRPVISKGECMHLCTTKSGATILSYGYRQPPYGIRAWPSYDHGKTWNPEDAFVIRDDGAMRDLGYPRSMQLPDGRIFCVYYYNVHDEDKSYYDEDATLGICKQWNLDPPLYTYQVAGLRFIGASIFTEYEMKQLAGTATFEEKVETQPTLL
jgi:sialidase-1